MQRLVQALEACIVVHGLVQWVVGPKALGVALWRPRVGLQWHGTHGLFHHVRVGGRQRITDADKALPAVLVLDGLGVLFVVARHSYPFYFWQQEKVRPPYLKKGAILPPKKAGWLPLKKIDSRSQKKVVFEKNFFW